MQRAGWNPWRAVRTMADVEVACGPTGGADSVLVVLPGQPVIVISRELTQVERNVALAHELVHLERGWPCQAGWAEEQRVLDEVARRLVPLGQLRRWVVERERSELTTEPWQVAEEWHVTDDVAARAMRLLWQDVRDWTGWGRG